MTRYKINHEIRVKETIVIDSDGNNLGNLPLQEAQRLASDKDLDLVLVSENNAKSVCKIMDYNKFIYEQKRKDRKNKKPRHEEVLKEFQIRPNIDSHDLTTKIKQISSLLEKKYRIKVFTRLFGRQQVNQKEKAYDILKKVYAEVTKTDLPEGAIRQEQNNISMYINTPKS